MHRLSDVELERLKEILEIAYDDTEGTEGEPEYDLRRQLLEKVLAFPEFRPYHIWGTMFRNDAPAAMAKAVAEAVANDTDRMRKKANPDDVLTVLGMENGRGDILVVLVMGPAKIESERLGERILRYVEEWIEERDDESCAFRQGPKWMEEMAKA